eukprot:6492678-Amphidinium_carterae.1
MVLLPASHLPSQSMKFASTVQFTLRGAHRARKNRIWESMHAGLRALVILAQATSLRILSSAVHLSTRVEQGRLILWGVPRTRKDQLRQEGVVRADMWKKRLHA